MKSITAIEPGTYEVALVGELGGSRTYTFEVEEEPIPVAIWTPVFEQEVGTLSRPGQQIAAAVLAFHWLCRTDVPMDLPS